MSNQITIRCRLATLVALILLGCASTERIAPEEANFETTIEAFGAPKDKIYDAGKLWIAETFTSARGVIDLDDKTAGILIGNGRIHYPSTGLNASPNQVGK